MTKNTKAELREQMRRQLQSAAVRAHSAAVWERLAVLDEFNFDSDARRLVDLLERLVEENGARRAG